MINKFSFIFLFLFFSCNSQERDKISLNINNSVEYNGTCYAQLIGPNSESVRKDTALLQNAATTDCKTIQINTSELVNGTWKITLNYSSTDTEGASSEISIKIN